MKKLIIAVAIACATPVYSSDVCESTSHVIYVAGFLRDTPPVRTKAEALAKIDEEIARKKYSAEGKRGAYTLINFVYDYPQLKPKELQKIFKMICEIEE